MTIIHKEYNTEDLESALIDLLDGQSDWYDIKYYTGLSDERCKEIETLYNRVLESYNKKHNIEG